MLPNKHNNSLLQCIGSNHISTISAPHTPSTRPNIHYLNVQQGFITIPEERLEKFARKYEDTIKNSFVWELFGILLSLLTSIFNIDIFNQPKTFTFFVCVTSIVGYKLLSCVKVILGADSNKINSPEDFVKVCKKNSIQEDWEQ